MRPPGYSGGSVRTKTEPEVFENYDAVIPIPGIVNYIVHGAGGRYLLIALRRLQKVGVFDVREGTVKKYVNVDVDGAHQWRQACQFTRRAVTAPGSGCA